MWVHLATGILVMLGTATGIVTLGAVASVIAGDHSRSTLIGLLVFGGLTVACTVAIGQVRSRGREPIVELAP